MQYLLNERSNMPLVYIRLFILFGGSQVALVVKNPSAIAGDVREASLIPGLGTSPGGGNGNPLQYSLAWRIPWTEQPGGLQSRGSQRVGHD